MAAEEVIQRDLIVIGASAGGVDALQEIVADLPPELPAAILVVLHVPSTGTSVLPQILSRRGVLPAVFAENGMPLERGQIYVAPADHHLLIHEGRIRLTQGPRENGHRPAVDPMFRSAARAAGPRCIGVVLSGLLDDGASGLRFIKDRGGIPVAQDPAEALFPSMPQAAIKTAGVEEIAPANGLGRLLCRLIDETLPAGTVVERASEELDRVEILDPNLTAELVSGPPTALTCPECGGALWEQDE